MQQSYEKIRKNMVDGQVCPSGVTDAALITALQSVPRERFVPPHLQSIAHVDEDIPLGNGRYLSKPMVLARLLQAAEVKKSDIALVVGCGAGYSTAVLGHLAGTVVGIEYNKGMADQADKLLHDLDVCNAVVVLQENLRAGYPQQGPYNVIFINGSVPDVPDAIKAQLADGGRLVTVVSRRGHMGVGMLVTRQGEGFSTKQLFDAAVPTLIGFEKPKMFSF